MNFKEWVRFSYGFIMGTSTPFLKPSKRHLFPTAWVDIDPELALFMGGSGICGVLQTPIERLVINVNRSEAALALRTKINERAYAEVPETIILNSVERDYSEGIGNFKQTKTVYVGRASEKDLKANLGGLLENVKQVNIETEIQVGGESIYLIPVGPAATESDLAVFFANRSVLFLGPLFFNRIHPVLYPDRGMDIGRWTEQVEALLARFHPRTVVPAEGDTGSVEDVRAFLAYLKALTDPEVEFSYCRKNYDWPEIPGTTSLEENFDLLREKLKSHARFAVR